MSEVPAAWDVMVDRLVEMDEKAVRSEFAESPAQGASTARFDF